MLKIKDFETDMPMFSHQADNLAPTQLKHSRICILAGSDIASFSDLSMQSTNGPIVASMILSSKPYHLSASTVAVASTSSPPIECGGNFSITATTDNAPLLGLQSQRVSLRARSGFALLEPTGMVTMVSAELGDIERRVLRCKYMASIRIPGAREAGKDLKSSNTTGDSRSGGLDELRCKGRWFGAGK
ncbi:hypothetical protein BDP27DRAFT_1479718 [Rhodocollybia butyracea]|uniref:Uncharacterized protein n=1 Tax=Rhodocollybia butyracea TaxID=206335 RepID=A0A9P5PJH5_9AGAR|nr:hypothetical protein BDP27DRAFT_1479718 [Rhodocollybia butyracea]